MSVIEEVDALYEGCVMDPDRWGEQAFADWVDGVALSTPLDRETARFVRRCVTAARKLAAYWRDADRARAPDDWRARVDLALGARAWRPQLELAHRLLDREPDPHLFARVSELFPVVTNQPFLDGIGYEEWLRERLQDRPEAEPGGTIAP